MPLTANKVESDGDVSSFDSSLNNAWEMYIGECHCISCASIITV